MTATNERDELAKVIAKTDGSGHFLRNGRQYAYGPLADAILAAGYTKPRQVTTTADLEDLPEGSLILSRSEYPRYTGTVWRVSSGRVVEKVGREAEGVTPFGYFKDPLPATVIHSPVVAP